MCRLPVRAAICSTLRLLALPVGVLVLAGCDALAPGVNAPPASPPPVAPPGADAGGNAADAAVDIDIPLEALLDRKSPPLVVGRNLFRFGSTPDVARPASAAAPPASGGGSVQGSAAPTTATGTTAMPPASAGVGAIRLIGVVEARNRVGRVAVLADGDGVYHGLVDDIVKGRYRILSITAASVEVEDVTRRTRMTLRLSGA